MIPGIGDTVPGVDRFSQNPIDAMLVEIKLSYGVANFVSDSAPARIGRPGSLCNMKYSIVLVRQSGLLRKA